MAKNDTLSKALQKILCIAFRQRVIGKELLDCTYNMRVIRDLAPCVTTEINSNNGTYILEVYEEV